MNIQRFMVFFGFVCAVAVLTSCSFPIKEQDRDRDSKYRGFWSTKISKAPSEAVAGASRYKCLNLAGIGNLEIAGGRVVARVQGFDLSGFIDAHGKFTSDVALSGQWKFAFNGQLDAVTGTGTGLLFHNGEYQGLGGCSSKVVLKREDL